MSPNISLATLTPGRKKENLEALFSGAPVAIFVDGLLFFLMSPSEVSKLAVGNTFQLNTVMNDSAIRWNPNTGISELVGYLKMDGLDRKALLNISPETFDPDFRPYTCLVTDPMRSSYTRRYVKSLMASLTHYEIELNVEHVASSGPTAKFWIARFNPEAASQHTHL